MIFAGVRLAPRADANPSHSADTSMGIAPVPRASKCAPVQPAPRREHGHCFAKLGANRSNAHAHVRWLSPPKCARLELAPQREHGHCSAKIGAEQSNAHAHVRWLSPQRAPVWSPRLDASMGIALQRSVPRGAMPMLTSDDSLPEVRRIGRGSLRCTLYFLLSTFYSLLATFFSLYSLSSTLYSLRSTLYSLPPTLRLSCHTCR